MEELKTEYMYQKEASLYLMTTQRKIALFRKYGLLRSAKLGKNFVFKKSWLDEFMETWSGYDLSSEEKIKLAINSKAWKERHETK